MSAISPTFDTPTTPKNNYGYNDKEFNGDLGLDWIDYGARWYDPQVSRWWSVDPLADKMPSHSPYNYGFNNPIKYIDRDGMLPTRYEDENGNEIRTTNDGSNAVVVVPNSKRAGFDNLIENAGSDLHNLDWNRRVTFYAIGLRLNSNHEAQLSQLNSNWARRNAVSYWADPTSYNAFKFSISEALSQWTNPQLVATGLEGAIGMGVMGSMRRGARNGKIIASSSGGRILPMKVEKVIPQGAKIADIKNDIKGMTWATGNEHAVVRLANGQKAIVSGGPGGIRIEHGQIQTLFGHTHPTSAPPSHGDYDFLRYHVFSDGTKGQSRQYVIHGGQVTLIRP